MGDFPITGGEQTTIAISSTTILESNMTPFMAITFTSTWPSANRAIFVPFRLHQTKTFVKLSIRNGATVTGNVDAGLYDTEGNRIVSNGSVAQSGTSALQTFDITDTTLYPGLYYYAVAMSSASATIGFWNAVNAAVSGGLGCLSMASALALPATATYAAAADGLIPWLSMTERATI